MSMVWLKNALTEPEHFSPEDLADIQEGMADIREGRCLTLEEYRRRGKNSVRMLELGSERT
jgi:hypothetical protein